MNRLLSLSLLAILWLLPASTRALAPKDVYLVVNKSVPASLAIAEHYCSKRGVPKDNIIALELPREEDISRKDYDEKLAKPLRDKLGGRREQVKVLLTIYGVPLRVGREESTAVEKEESEKLRQQMDPLQKKMSELQTGIARKEADVKADPKSPAADELPDLRKERDALQKQIRGLEERRKALQHDESEACVDSELALLWWSKYPLRRWQMNLLYFQFPEDARKDQPPMLMTCRLDGPSLELVKKIIDVSIEVEKTGLAGKVYVDARGIKYNPKDDPGFGYGGYDESLREMARLLEKEANLSVTLDDKPELFPPGSCPDCALYCGWYSLANYVDSCRFAPGAVAYHIASSEAVSLRNKDSKLWCKNMLERGVVATLGPVAEPYTLGFPKPAEFFGFLVTGEYTLVECYWRTEMLASWMTVLVGDPLYNPYGKTPKLKSAQVKPSPVGGQFRMK
jgi:uncharacterized protein (TIGR03790 family)